MNAATLSRPIAITPGEPAGVGPDLLLSLACQGLALPVVAIADPLLLHKRAQHLGLKLQIKTVNPPYTALNPADPGELYVYPIAFAQQVSPGHAHCDNAAALLRCLDHAVDGCLNEDYCALATGPMNKAIINDAGIPFTGHTEYLATRCGREDPVMMLAGGGLRVALVTTHLALREVSDAITQPHLEKTIRILNHDLKQHFGIHRPRITVLGLNPHAGESGHMGLEEIEVITPVLEKLRAEGLHLIGPLPADTAFNPGIIDNCDVVLAMYHDQGLPVLKHASFGHGVNITLGLPMIRTSVDHGTAYDLAGSGKANSQSFRDAITLAAEMAINRDG